MKPSKDLNWSFSTLGCPDLNLEEVVQLAKSNGISRLELRTLEGRVDLPALFRERYDEPARLKSYLDGAGARVVALDTSLKLAENTTKDRAAFLEFVEWAECLETPYLRVFDGGSIAPELSEKDLQGCQQTISWWRGLKQEHGWKTDIMVETHDCLTATSAVRQLQATLDKPLPILWDTHHTWKKGGEALAHTWSSLKEGIVHVHIKDSISVPSARHPFTYVMLGEGEFNLDESLGLLCESDFEGTVSIEWERQWHPYLLPMKEALVKARDLGWW